MQEAYSAAPNIQYDSLCRYRDDCKSFLKNNKDFVTIYEKMMNKFSSFYEASGKSKEEAHKLVRLDEAAIVLYAQSNGLDPAEVMYNTARRNEYGE